MQARWVRYCAWMFLVICASGSLLLAQQQAPPDTILYNGKIVTIDDHGVNENVGTVAQAIAIRGDSIVAVGNNAQIRAIAGPNTKSIDLKGRTVLPGMGGTHDHPMDWDTITPLIVNKVITDDIFVQRFINVPPDQVMQQFPRVLEEAVQKAKPGQWVRIATLYGPDYAWTEISGFFGRQITKQMLDLAAPNNPVQIRGGFTGQVLNQKAIDLTKAWYGDQWDKFTWNPFGAENTDKTGVGGTNYRWLEQDVLFPQKELQEIYRLGLEWMGGYGLTYNSGGLYTPGAVAAYHALDRRGQMAIRMPWSYQWRPRPDLWSDPYFNTLMANMMGQGSDHLWLTGLWPSDNGAGCTNLQRIDGQEEAQQQQRCNFAPDWREGENRIALYNMVKAGGRLSGIHTGGDKDVDYILDVIEEASKDAGMTIEQIRAMRHGYDHMADLRPDQIPRIKNLGVIPSGLNLSIYTSGLESRLRQYGERGVERVQPRKSLLDAGVWNSVEIDRPIAYTNLTYFHVLYAGITRKDRDGNVWAPNQAVSREAMLKFATLGGAHYVKREDKLGSLEPGKWADLSVLDKDYLTVPVEQIKDLHVYMTMVGGKIIHLVPSLAREWGLQPTGAQVELGGPAAQW